MGEYMYVCTALSDSLSQYRQREQRVECRTRTCLRQSYTAEVTSLKAKTDFEDFPAVIACYIHLVRHIVSLALGYRIVIEVLEG